MTDFDLLAYCLMPNHLHMLAQGRSDTADLRKFVHRFKQLPAFDYKKTTGTLLWQTSYYDRALRRGDDLQTVADYIFANPVKDGIVPRAVDDAHSGGSFFDAAQADGVEAIVRPSAGDRDEVVAHEAPQPDGAEATVPTRGINEANVQRARAEAAVPTSAISPANPFPKELTHEPA